MASSHRVMIVGMDQLAFFASYLRHLLALLDIRAEVVASPRQDSITRLSRVDEDSLVIAFSAGKAHPIVIRAMKLARHRRARTLAITDATLSEVGEHADLTLYYSSNSPSFTRSNAALLAIVQALAYGVYDRDRGAYKDRIRAFKLTPATRTTKRLRRILGAMAERATFRVKRGLAEMLKGGVIMDVTNAEQARIAEDSGAVAVMALERVPADIRAEGGVARMASPRVIKEIQESVTIPVMAKARIGHFAEAQILQSLEVDYIDESEVLTPADEAHHIDKQSFEVPFVCGATNLGEALRRIAEGAAMIRSKGEAGTGNIVEAVRHLRDIVGGIKHLSGLAPEQLSSAAKDLGAPLEIVAEVAESGWLPVPLFCAGGIATPADAALVMQLGAEGNFVGSGIFKSEDPERRARAIVEATTHFNDPERLAAASIELGEPMRGDDIAQLAAEGELLQQRGV